MTSILKEEDKVFTMYKQYKELIHKDAEESEGRVYGVDQLAVQLTVAHMLDHVVCLDKEDKLPTAREVDSEVPYPSEYCECDVLSKDG